MKSDVGKIKIIFYYKYFPFLGLALCAFGEILFQLVPSFAPLKGILIFYIWPIILIAWLVFYARKNPDLTINNYYLFVVLVFSVFTLAVMTPLVSNLLGFSKNTRQKISENLGNITVVLYLILAIYQLWAIRRKKKLDEKTKCDDLGLNKVSRI